MAIGHLITGGLGNYSTTLSAEEIASAVRVELATELSNIVGIKAKTDSLTFTSAGVVDSNIRQINSVLVEGAGTTIDPWGPA